MLHDDERLYIQCLHFVAQILEVMTEVSADIEGRGIDGRGVATLKIFGEHRALGYYICRAVY